MDYPSNSNKKRDPVPEEPKNVQKVVTGEVIQRKQSLAKRFKDIFIGGDAQSVWAYVAYEILIPAVKDTASDAVSMGIEKILFGDARGGSRGRPRSSGAATGYVNYSGFSKGSTSRYGREEPRQLSRQARASHDFREIVLETRPEAELVIERLDDLCDRYGQASVTDLYELVGVTGDFTDEKYGWTDMRSAGVRRVRDGFLLELPRTEVLDR